jgi:hypothetical protein
LRRKPTLRWAHVCLSAIVGLARRDLHKDSMPRFLKHGEVLRERYQIRERIGQGGAGSIYLAMIFGSRGGCAPSKVEYDRLLPGGSPGAASTPA